MVFTLKFVGGFHSIAFFCFPILWLYCMRRYNNDDARYWTYPTEEYDDHELEATFLSNVRTTFDPAKCSQDFTACLLPQWSKYMKEQLGKDREYVLRFTMDRTDNIRSIEQVAFNFVSKDNRAPFPRNVRRLVDGIDCIEFLYRDSSTFVTVCCQYIHSGTSCRLHICASHTIYRIGNTSTGCTGKSNSCTLSRIS